MFGLKMYEFYKKKKKKKLMLKTGIIVSAKDIRPEAN